MPQKLETVLKHVEEISNDVNRQLIYDYHKALLLLIIDIEIKYCFQMKITYIDI